MPLPDNSSKTHALRIHAVQERLCDLGLHALIVPSSDPHLSEYLPAYWQGRAWLSGFTGSMGTLVVTRTQAALFADSRYWVQAEAQLVGSGIRLEKINSGSSTQHVDWLASQVQPGHAVAVDGRALSVAAFDHLHAALRHQGAALRTDLDVLGEVWPDRPALPRAAVFEHLPPHADASRADKLLAVRQAMANMQASHHLISTLDDVAWLLNLRGADVPYNPVFLAHLLLTPVDATLFVDSQKISTELQNHLLMNGVRTAPYDEVTSALACLPDSATVLLDPHRCTIAFKERLPQTVTVIYADNPSTLLKSRKSTTALQHWRQTMELDGAAMCEFYAAFEALLADHNRTEPLTELSVDTMLHEARSRQPGYVGPSFATIAGFNANGAMPHYRATPQSHAVIEGQGLLLIDSGGQYLGGTTDITRVWPIGEVSEQQQRDYTLVLKGLIALSRCRFPVGTPSPMLDSIARAPLWEHGLDYGHGTGHGVGYFLNVHEGPQSISRNPITPNMGMQAGMVTSIEPGVYRPGLWGIRLENLVAAVPAVNTGFGEFLAFETLSLCPIDTRCLWLSALRDDERLWLNDYHQEVRERLQNRLGGAALGWLLARTAAV
ncbi:MAG: aminopeptidase P family protein [Burkholderiales bacterium]